MDAAGYYAEQRADEEYQRELVADPEAVLGEDWAWRHEMEDLYEENEETEEDDDHVEPCGCVTGYHDCPSALEDRHDDAYWEPYLDRLDSQEG